MHGVSPLDYPNFEHVSDVDGEDATAFAALKTIKQQRRLMTRVMEDMGASPPSPPKRARSDTDLASLKSEVHNLKNSLSNLKKNISRPKQTVTFADGLAQTTPGKGKGKGKGKGRGRGRGRGAGAPAVAAAADTSGPSVDIADTDWPEWRSQGGWDANGRQRCWNFDHNRRCSSTPCRFSHEAAADDQTVAEAAGA